MSAATAGGGHVLVVDDEPENLDLIEELLVEEGFEVTRAGDGAAALRAVEERSPDCIVLDVMMPVLDGFSVCRVLKGSRRTGVIPIVVLTALSEVTDKVLALNVGADDFLNKPVDQAELAARVRSLVRIRRLRNDLDVADRLLLDAVRFAEARVPGRAGHSERVAALSILLARRLPAAGASLEAVARAGLLYDVGKELLSGAVRAGWGAEGGRHAAAGEPFPLAAEVVEACNLFDGLLCAGQTPAAAAARLRDDVARGAFRPEVVEILLANDATLAIRPGLPVPRWEDLLPPPAGPLRGRILVAVERRANREVLEEILATAGHEATFVDGGEAALRSASESRPDLALIDLQASEPDGITVCRRLKESPGGEVLPSIVVLSWPEPRARMRAVAAGADDLLLHPIDRLELVARVKSLLRLRLFVKDLERQRELLRALAGALGASAGEGGLPPALAAFLAAGSGPGDRRNQRS